MPALVVPAVPIVPTINILLVNIYEKLPRGNEMTFQKGDQWQGNPRGRPTGTGHRQQLFKNLVEPHKEALLDTAIKLALGGNESMLRLFIERMLPPKPTDDTVTLYSRA